MEKICFEAVPKDSVGAEVMSGGRLLQMHDRQQCDVI